MGQHHQEFKSKLILPENSTLSSTSYYKAKETFNNAQSSNNFTISMLNNTQDTTSDEAINVLDEDQENVTTPLAQSTATTINSVQIVNDNDQSMGLFRNFKNNCNTVTIGRTPLPAFEYIAPTKPAFHLSSLTPMFGIHRLPVIFPNFLQRRTRGEKRIIPDELKDDKYFERRKRNNEAAKKSRDARKIREDRNTFRAALLEQENSILRAQLITLREELTTLKQLIATTSTTSTALTSNFFEKGLL